MQILAWDLRLSYMNPSPESKFDAKRSPDFPPTQYDYRIFICTCEASIVVQHEGVSMHAPFHSSEAPASQACCNPAICRLHSQWKTARPQTSWRGAVIIGLRLNIIHLTEFKKHVGLGLYKHAVCTLLQERSTARTPCLAGSRLRLRLQHPRHQARSLGSGGHSLLVQLR